MKEQQDTRKWHLMRNNNGEWVSSEQTVRLDNFSAIIYRTRAKQYGLPLSSQTWYEGETWYYKHEIEAVEAAMEVHQAEVKPRNLKIPHAKQKPDETEINKMVMNMFKPKTSGNFNALDEACPLWQELEKNPPLWWKNLLADKDLYVEIRKDNYANVYYHGGNIALIRWTNGEVTAETHQKYLGDSTPAKTIINKKSGKVKPIYEYRDCREQLRTKEGLEDIKSRIRGIYHDIHGANNRGETREARDRNKHLYTSSEKSVQGALKLCFPDRYIDSEFAYHWPYTDKKGKKHTTIRIDLVELREKTLVFTELKLITDPRLRAEKEEAEIISQMGAYANFIKQYVEELKSYYTKLLQIKQILGLWKGETDIESVSLTPELLIVNTYKKEDKMSEGKEKRINAIKGLKEKTTFDTSIVDYLDLCE